VGGGKVEFKNCHEKNSNVHYLDTQHGISHTIYIGLGIWQADIFCSYVKEIKILTGYFFKEIYCCTNKITAI